MDIFDILTLIGGLCLFLFGMNLMGTAPERSAGNRLNNMIGKLITGKLASLFTGLGVTAVIQSSSATTVMVVGFVNSKLMTLKKAIHVIKQNNRSEGAAYLYPYDCLTPKGMPGQAGRQLLYAAIIRQSRCICRQLRLRASVWFPVALK